MAKQVCDIKAGKGMSIAQSNEHLRVGAENAYKHNIAGTYDPTREHLNFEIIDGKIQPLDKKNSITKRIRKNLEQRGIIDPNAGLTAKDPRLRNTVANIILQGSRDRMLQLAFGNQNVVLEHGADNSHVTRCEDIEKWSLDMYKFMCNKYGEKNIAAFVVHLDETNPHIHCTLLPITEKNKFSFNKFFGGKYEGPEKLKELHDELAEVNAKWGLDRGDSVLTTGAKHKSYIQWLKGEIDNALDDMEKYSNEIDKQKSEIDSQKEQLYRVNAEIKKAEKRQKGLQTMLKNLNMAKDDLEMQISNLEENYHHGEISYNELEAKKIALQQQIEEIENKIFDKQEKLSIASQELSVALTKKENLNVENEILKQTIEEELSSNQEKIISNVRSTAWQMFEDDLSDKSDEIKNFTDSLSPEQKKSFDDIFNMLPVEDIAERGSEIIAVASALSVGLVTNAVAYANSTGGGGGGSSPGSGWGKGNDEDDDAFRRRCIQTALMMMRPAGRKRKRS